MKPEAVTCPECGGPMVSRTARVGGRRFWGCKQFPKCKGTRNTDGESPEERRAFEGFEPGDEGSPSERQARNDRRRW
jgi:ssDNA-binding Zn-finger/Zn-ribbon topoisomerase 1